MDKKSTKDEIHEILDKEDDLVEASKTVLSGPRAVALYCIQLALEYITARRRASKRRELRRVVRPEFNPPGVTGRVTLTKKAKQRIVDNARELFASWMINAKVSLGDATKEDLLEQADAEMRSAEGHIRNAQFYRALAEPLEEGQRAKEYWNPKRVQELKDKIWEITTSA